MTHTHIWQIVETEKTIQDARVSGTIDELITESAHVRKIAAAAQDFQVNAWHAETVVAIAEYIIDGEDPLQIITWSEDVCADTTVFSPTETDCGDVDTFRN